MMIYQPWIFDIHRGQRSITILKLIQNLNYVSLYPKDFYLYGEKNETNQLWVQQTTREH